MLHNPCRQSTFAHYVKKKVTPEFFINISELFLDVFGTIILEILYKTATKSKKSFVNLKKN